MIEIEAPVPINAHAGPRRLSLVRVLLAAVIVGLVGGGVWLFINRDEVLPQAAASPSAGWTAPYVDATITPFFPFEDPGENVSDIVLSFIVAHRDDPCEPAWGSVFSLDAAAVDLDLDRRLVRLRQTGKDAVVSFGGAINDELAVSCPDVESLADAYAAVVERYDVATIDFDIEGAALDDPAAHRRRAEAVAAVQQARYEADEPLNVWLTLPVTPSGLTSGGLAVLDAMLASNVDVSGVNIMTMNFNVPRAHSSSSSSAGAMFDLVSGASEATAVQLRGAWSAHGRVISPGEVWGLIGVTPMIGRNDVTHEVFTMADAQLLADFAIEHGIARVSYWSLNRDRPCPPNEAPIVEASNVCAHLDIDVGAFAGVFTALDGRAFAADGPPGLAFEVLEDDPERSPYPIWQPDQAFQPGAKVVWHGYVYEAKWYSLGGDPEAPVENIWETPWRVVGPVLPQDLLEPVRVPRSAAPPWSADAIYTAGDRVWLDGAVYEAKWWTQSEAPGRPAAAGHESPWERLDPRLVPELLDSDSG